MMYFFLCCFCFFFFKQKTAYELRISDWSSDVCSSDLVVQLIAALLRSRALDRNGFMEVVSDLFAMPATMRQLAVVQFFSWFAMFAMWIYGTPAVAEFHFAAPDPATRGYQDAADWWALLGSLRNGVAAAAALCFIRSEEHTSELQSLMRITYAVFCLKNT